MGPTRLVRLRRLTIALALVSACTPGTSTARGIVTAVDGSLQAVESFSLLVDGDEMTFVPVADGDYAFPLPHLRDHLLSGEPLLVEWEIRDGLRVALSIADG